MRRLKIACLLICCACFVRCTVKKYATAANGISIIKEQKKRDKLLGLPEISGVSFSFIEKETRKKMGLFTKVFINRIQFIPDTNGQFSIKLFPGKYNIQCMALGYYTSKLKLKVEKQYDYKINIRFNQDTGIVLH